jgi:hypothetical protein
MHRKQCSISDTDTLPHNIFTYKTQSDNVAQKKVIFVKFEVLTAVTMKSTVF